MESLRSIPAALRPREIAEEHTGAGDALVRYFRRHPKLADRIESIVRRALKRRHQFAKWVLLSLLGRVQPVFLEYPVDERPRFVRHPELYPLIDGGRSRYAELLRRTLSFREALAVIPSGPEEAAPNDPTWVDVNFGGLDGAALYSVLASTDPARFVEVGSGNSTRFARRAIADRTLRTKITSIDPEPRAEVDAICDEVVRGRLEDVDLAIFNSLRPDDILFLDGSHRVFMNSDVTVFFLEVLPRLNPGVLVHVHDIFLPDDYPQGFVGRFFSEQYVLASFLLGGAAGAEIVLPCAFVSGDPELSAILAPLWSDDRMATATTHGSSFWVRTG